MLPTLVKALRRMRMKAIKPFGRKLLDGLVRVSLCDRNPEVARALADAFRDNDGAEVLEGDLLALDCDAVVSPSNSFGSMDGGIDRHIDRFSEGKAQDAVLALVAERFYGELPGESSDLEPWYEDFKSMSGRRYRSVIRYDGPG
jgi:hypothetical protein